MGNFPPSKLFCPPNKSNLPIAQIAHPVNYLAHRKKSPVIITNRHFRPNFVQNWLISKLETRLVYPSDEAIPQSCPETMVNIQVSLTSTVNKPMIALDLKSDIFLSFQGKHIVSVLDAQNWKLLTQLIIFLDF